MSKSNIFNQMSIPEKIVITCTILVSFNILEYLIYILSTDKYIWEEKKTLWYSKLFLCPLIYNNKADVEHFSYISYTGLQHDQHPILFVHEALSISKCRKIPMCQNLSKLILISPFSSEHILIRRKSFQR